jgi:uncharacterized protein
MRPMTTEPQRSHLYVLSPDVVTFAVKAVFDTYGRGENLGIGISYSTVTNGSLITDEIAKTFAEFQVGVCVSFDSPTSPSRPLKNGESSAQVVSEGLRMLQKYGNRVAINAAITSETWQDFDRSIIDFACEYGASEIGILLDFDPTFYAKFNADEIVSKLWPVIEEGGRRNVLLTGYWHQIFQVLLGFEMVQHRGFKNCSAKGAQLSIEPNGSVFSCKAGSGLFGSIHEEAKLLESSVYKQHAAMRHSNPDFCNGCEIEGFCGGICLGPLQKKFGTVETVEPLSCEIYRAITRKLVSSLAPYEVATFDLAESAVIA